VLLLVQNLFKLVYYNCWLNSGGVLDIVFAYFRKQVRLRFNSIFCDPNRLFFWNSAVKYGARQNCASFLLIMNIIFAVPRYQFLFFSRKFEQTNRPTDEHQYVKEPIQANNKCSKNKYKKGCVHWVAR